MGWKSGIAKVAAISGIIAAGGIIYGQVTKPPRPVVTLPTAGKLMLTGVTIVDPRTGTLAPGRSVLMEGGLIVRVGPGDLAPGDAGVQRVAATGKYLVPGYNDMHVHALGPDDPSGGLALMLANGITGFRQMHGSDELLEERRTSRLPIGKDAPALLAMPGALLTPFNANDPAMALASVHRARDEGADFIKVGLVSRPVLYAVLDEAKRLGIPVAGHVPASVDVVDAGRRGMRSIEHLGPSDGALVACSSAHVALRHELDAAPVLKGPPVRLAFLDGIANWMLAKVVVNPATQTTPDDTRRRAVLVRTFDEGRCRNVARALRAAGNWQVPTLIRRKTSEQADDPAFTRDSNLRFMPPKTVELWRSTTASYIEKVPADARRLFRTDYALSLRLVKIFDEEGVPMLAGSDTVGAGWTVPGISLHQEFDELAKAGLSPLRILQMTTINSARFLSKTATMGSVEPGRNADLVLLDGDPTRDVANLHRISGLVRAGFFYDRVALDALMDRVAAGKGYLK